MHISPAQHNLNLGRNAPGYERTPGLHMSDLYNSLYKALEPKRYSDAGPMPLEKIEMGLVWEEALEEGFKRRLTGEERPGEFVTDHEPGCPNKALEAGRLGTVQAKCHCGAGIIFSPDLLIPGVAGESILGEIKLTWMSIGGPKSKNRVPVSVEQAEGAGRPELANTITEFPPKFGKWFTQIACYLYHLKLTKARLIVFFVNGNYAPPTPIGLTWDLEFSPRELAEEWQAVRNHAIAEGVLVSKRFAGEAPEGAKGI